VKSKRPDGFYWVRWRSSGKWTVIEFADNSSFGYSVPWITGSEVECEEGDFDPDEWVPIEAPGPTEWAR